MKPIERVFVGALGVLLLGAGIYMLFRGEVSLVWRCLAGAVFIALGAHVAYRALVGKRTWLSTIGPLP